MSSLFPQFTSTVSLEARNVAMMRGETILFSGLSAKITSGDILWIQGANGIGKTTLLGALAGLSRIDDGDIIWESDGELMQANQIVTYQPHQNYAKATLTAKEDIAFWAKIYGTADLVDEVLIYVGLSNKTSVPTQYLSAGQRRRLALAKLLISQKPVWIMDEPAAAMDVDGTELIDKCLKDNIARGGAAIIASHGEARGLSSHTRKLTLRVVA